MENKESGAFPIINRGIECSQEREPKSTLENEVEMELQVLLKDKNQKGPKLDITLYFGEHSAVNSAIELAKFCEKEKIDLLADEYVYTGDFEEMIDPIKDADLLKKKKTLAESSLGYGQTLDKILTTPAFRHDIAPGDFLRKEIIVGLTETTDFDDKVFGELTKYSFEEFCGKLIRESEKRRNLQRTREGVIFQTFPQKTAKGIINNNLVGKEELKTLIFFGQNHFQCYKNFAQLHPNFIIHFQDPYINQWILDNPGKTPPFAAGMTAYNSVKNEEDLFVGHEKYEKDPYRYIAQELALRWNNQSFHERRGQLFKLGLRGEIYDRVTKEIDEMAKDYKGTEKESSYHKAAKVLFDEFQAALRKNSSVS